MQKWTKVAALTAAICSLTLCVTSQGQQIPSGKPAAIATLPAYPDKTGGLERLIGAIFHAAKTGDQTGYEALLSGLSGPVPESWYRDTFGGDGGLMLKEYSGVRGQLEAELKAFFLKMRNERYTQVTAYKHEASCDDNSGEAIYPVMVMRQSPVPLYELRFHEGDRFYRLWAFAYIDNGFRYVGELRPPEYFPPTPVKKSAAEPGVEKQAQDPLAETEKRLRVGGNAVAARIVNRVQPVYPPIAQGEHLQGTVTLHAIIGKDGKIHNLRVLKGYCSLSVAAIDAVRKWRYTPTLLEGKPVEVDTTIDVIFALNR